jgi:hypothetical protein
MSHVWVVAAEIEVIPKIASVADYHGSFKAAEGQRVDALEVYCRECRRPYDEVKGDDCAAKIDNTHLIGGDKSVRAKRKIPTPAADRPGVVRRGDGGIRARSLDPLGRRPGQSTRCGQRDLQVRGLPHLR